MCILCLFSAQPLPCLSGCLCYYSVDHQANTVNCSYNNMTTLPAKLLPRTELLIMTGNNLGNLDSVPENFPKINVLYLNKSSIKTISDGALKILLNKTENLYLSNNNLKEISSLLQAENVRTNLWLSENPYNCNCDMMWMRDWLLNATIVKDKGNVTCGGGEWQGKCCKISFNKTPYVL